MTDKIGVFETNHIYNMDCLDGMRQIPDKSVDVSFTSPPYNRVVDDTYDYFCDVSEDYYKLLVDTTDEMLRLTKKNVIVNIQMNACNKIELCKWIGRYADEMRGVIVWEKTNPRPASNPREDGTFSVTNAYEFFFVLGGAKEFRANGKIKNIIQTSVNSEHFEGHGAVMKREVCDWFIKHFTVGGDLVMDCFSGLGTTALCCELLGRKYIGFEITEEYHRASLERIKRETAQIRLDLGELWN